MNRRFFFSIIVPCYNQGKFLGNCIDSIIRQEYSSIEIIIINDGSTDETQFISNSLAKKDNRIKVKYQNNQGLSAARNLGLSYAKGEYLLFLDADDWLEPGLLKSCLNTMDNFPDYDLYRWGYSYWSVDAEKKYHTHFPNGDGLIYPNVLTQNIGACHSILISKRLADQLGGFDPHLRSCEDWDYWIRAGKIGAKIKSIPQDLVAYRYVPLSMSRNAQIMYQALSEVQHRALCQDPRIPLISPYNKDMEGDISTLIKNHFIKCMGVTLHQGKVEEAISWFLLEKEKWDWQFEPEDFADMNSQLTFRYFLEKQQILDLLQNHLQHFKDFFLQIGYKNKEIKHLLRIVFEPQLKMLNHIRYGKYLGAVLNRLLFK